MQTRYFRGYLRAGLACSLLFVQCSTKGQNWTELEQSRWNNAQVRKEKVHYVQAICAEIKRNQVRYQAVQDATGVPWRVIACVHSLEGSLNFRTNLGQGDPLTARSRHVPRGRPPTGNPPFTWEVAAIDALRFDAMDRKIWATIDQTLLNLESWNGTGMLRFHPDIPTPYLWSYTNLYDLPRGKYIEDGHWSSTAVSQQCGAAALLKNL